MQCHPAILQKGQEQESFKVKTICDPLQQKVPYGPCYKLLVWYKYYSVKNAQHSAVFSSQEVHDITGRKL